MTTLQLNLLGPPQIIFNGVLVSRVHTAKTEALFYFLAASRRPHLRTVLADLLWPDMTEAQARRNLTQSLAVLRKQFAPFLQIETHQIALNQDADIQLDVATFERCLASTAITDLQIAAELYRADFLEGVAMKEALPFEEWLLVERERLREMMLTTLDRLVTHFMTHEETEAGSRYARRLLALDPWREATHRQLMLLLARSGQRDAALAQYDKCREVLAAEFGAEPDEETRALYHRLKAIGQPPPHNLPLPPNVFVGRAEEVNQAMSELSRPGCRLLTIVGPGGMGKTRLALEVARRLTTQEAGLTGVDFSDGLFLVELAPLKVVKTGAVPGSQAHLLATTIGEALGISFQGAAEVTVQLKGYLRTKGILLVLDNFEHLLAAAGETVGLLLEIMQTSVKTKLLVTSRERLNVQEEWLLELTGLAYPQEDRSPGSPADWPATAGAITPAQSLNTYSAIDLFVQRARQVKNGYELSEAELPHVVRLCQLAQGMPLALELAASWLRALPSAEIVTELKRSLDFLATSVRNVPERHRSIRAAFEQSWGLLSGREQEVFEQLSVFRGGFQREAAQAVTATSLTTLAGLVDKSLLRLTASGRYEIHELLRQFAAARLANRAHTSGVPPQSVEERHSRYYLGLLGRSKAELYGGRPQQIVAALQDELDNIRQAWHWAAANARLSELNYSLEALVAFYELLGLFQEGEEVFRATGASFGPFGRPKNRDQQTIVCRLLVERARFVSYLGQYKRAKAIIEQAEPLVVQLNEALILADLRLVLGLVLIFLGDLDEAVECLNTALTSFQDLNQRRRAAATLSQLGEAYSRKQMQDNALCHLQQALQIDTELGDKRAQALTSSRIGNVYAYKDMNEKAMAYYQQALLMFEELDDTPGVAKSLSNIGLTYYYLGQYTAVFEPSNQALQLHRRLGNIWGEANTLENLGIVYLALGEYQPALECLEQGLALSQQGGSKLAESYITYRLGKLHVEVGAYEKSRTYLQQATALAGDMGDPALAAMCLGDLGRIHHREQDHETALAYYDQAITNLLHLGARFEAMHVMVYQASLLVELGRLKAAQTLADDAIRLAQEIGYPPIAAAGQHLSARIMLAVTGQTEKE